MRLLIGLLFAALFSFTQAHALDLAWASGSSSLNFSTSTACTLVVRSTGDEAGLSSEWRLTWVARGCPNLQVQLNPSGNNTGPAEPLSEIAQNRAELLAHVRTLRFTSSSLGPTPEARIPLVLPAGSAGNFQVVELIPQPDGDSLGLIRESGIATFNGGISAPMPSAILAASSDHSTALLKVRLKGKGLSYPTTVSVGGAEQTWELPLAVIETNDTTLIATATSQAPLPDAYVTLLAPSGASAATALAGDTVTITPVVKGNSWLVVPEDPAVVVPKDFAFIYNSIPTGTPRKWKSRFHIIYIRRFVSPGVPEDNNETSFGHLWSEDLSIWHRDTSAFLRGTHGPDKLHVWAPSIVQNGDKYIMYYTGVDSLHDQRILRVTTAALDTSNTQWSDDRTKVFDVASPASLDWMVKKRLAPPNEGQQLRDPYVFPDPAQLGRYLMLFSAQDSLAPFTPLAVGLARNNPGTLDSWTTLGRYLATTKPVANIGRLESPHAFPQPSGANWRIMFTDATAGRTSSLRMITTAGASTPVTDLGATSWSAPQTVYTYLAPDTTVSGWVASEQLRAGTVDFLAAQNAHNFDGIHIARMLWSGSAFQLQTPSIVSVDDVGSSRQAPSLSLRNFAPGRKTVEFLLKAPVATRVRLTIYDVQGRMVMKVLDKTLQAGSTVAAWDSRDSSGEEAHAGMYFALLGYDSGTKTLSFPILR